MTRRGGQPAFLASAPQISRTCVVADKFEARAVARPDAITKLRHEAARYAQSLGASPELLDSLRLAVSEALTNIVLHAYLGREPGLMIVEAWCDEDEHLLVRICDEGDGLRPRADSPGLGVGIGLMASMAEDFRIANREETPGTIVSLRFSLGKEAACAS